MSVPKPVKRLRESSRQRPTSGREAFLPTPSPIAGSCSASAVVLRALGLSASGLEQRVRLRARSVGPRAPRSYPPLLPRWPTPPLRMNPGAEGRQARAPKPDPAPVGCHGSGPRQRGFLSGAAERLPRLPVGRASLPAPFPGSWSRLPCRGRRVLLPFCAACLVWIQMGPEARGALSEQGTCVCFPACVWALICWPGGWKGNGGS